MADFVLMPYSGANATEWDKVVLSSKNGNFLHLRAYMDYHAHRFDEQSLIVTCKRKPVAVFPCNRQGDMIVSHGGLTYGGLIYGCNLRVEEVLRIFDALMAYFRVQGISILRYKAIPHVFHRYPAEEDLYALFRHNARLVRRDISSVVSIENRMKLSDSRKCTIRKAEKNGVGLVEGGDLHAFHDLLESVLQKFDSAPVHSCAELKLLQSRFSGQIRLFSAVKDNQLLAGALVYDFGHVVHTQYLASSYEGREIGALDFVLANLLDKIFAERRYFSFGISTEHDGRYLNEGLIFQKEGFGGRGVVHDVYELEF